MKRAPRGTPLAVKIWNYVNQSGDCWLWTGATRKDGYGLVNNNGTMVYAHRAVYELLRGPIGPGLHIDHLCRTRNCVNPSHLDPVEPATNVARGKSGGNNAAKTHCPRGHAYDETNTFTSGGSRKCKACNNNWTRAWALRKKEQETNNNGN